MKIKILIVSMIIFILLVAPSYAAGDNQTRIAIDSPSQVKPGTSIPIYMAIYHLGDMPIAPLESGSDIQGLINSLEADSKSDIVTIDSIEVFNPVLGRNPSDLSLSQSQVRLISRPNALLRSVGGALTAPAMDGDIKQ